MAKLAHHALAAALLVASSCPQTAPAGEIELRSKETLTALEMDRGDELRFSLQDGRVFTLRLDDTDASIVERVTPGGIVYRFAARVRVDGQPMTLERFVCSQECFYEPYVIDGVRIWLDTVKDVFDLIPIRYPREGNLQCLPRKDARLALQEARRRICPQEMLPWIEEQDNYVAVGRCYNGDDCYLGPYLGQACHVGMDINQVKGSVLRAPIDFDTQAYFNSLAMGHNNNRWRGIRRWPGGDVWALQTHHLIELLVPENQPVAAGTRYATTAGVHVGSHEHTHFEFKIGKQSVPELAAGSNVDLESIAVPIDFDDQSPVLDAHPQVLHLDPWIIFWQIFEDRRRRRGELRSAIVPFGPGRTGAAVTFASDCQPSDSADRHRYFWTFGDGASASGLSVRHVFVNPGVYPVTLVVDDGASRSTTTHQIAISGDPVELPALTLLAPDGLSFRKRPSSALDVYGRAPHALPHTLQFLARSSRPVPDEKIVLVRNAGAGKLERIGPTGIDYEAGNDWLQVSGGGGRHDQTLEVGVDATGLAIGMYAASIQITSPGALNSPQCFRVELQVSDPRDTQEVTVDNDDPGFYATPYFWVGHRFCRCPAGKRGYGGFYLTNGGRAATGHFARFTPDLAAGRYEVSFPDETPFAAGVEFDVRVRHAAGDETIRVRPEQSRSIGVWTFNEGADGYVEILAERSHGLVIADAVTFRHRGLSGRD
jgi:hypothetical protein